MVKEIQSSHDQVVLQQLLHLEATSTAEHLATDMQDSLEQAVEETESLGVFERPATHMKDSHKQTMNEIDSVAAQLVPQQFVQPTETASTLPAEVARQDISMPRSHGPTGASAIEKGEHIAAETPEGNDFAAVQLRRQKQRDPRHNPVQSDVLQCYLARR